MIGVKQSQLINIGKRNGRVTIDDLYLLYPQRDLAIPSMKSLEAQGYFKEEVFLGIPVWIYIGDKK